MKEKNNKKIIIGLILGILLLIIAVLLFMYLKKPKFEIKIDTNGHKLIKDIKIKDNKIRELPQIKLDKDEDFVTWVNKDNEAIRTELSLTRNDTFTPITQPSKQEKVRVRFVSGTDEKIPDIVLNKGSKIILPVRPSHKTWTFLYWVDKDGYIVLKDKVVNEDMTIYAYWLKSEKKEVTISFDTGTDEKISDIKVTQGSKIIFPTPKKNKEGYHFNGWQDKNGNILDSNYIVNENMKLTAHWQSNYKCPDNCIPNEDGKTCKRNVEIEPTVKKTCDGTIYYNSCIDLNDKESGDYRQCSSWEDGTEVDYYDGEKFWCVKKKAWTEEVSCPADYQKIDNKCIKEETVECTLN